MQTSTLTPIPTLSDQDALEVFVNLIEKDGECDLPCWLDVTPGQTRFEEVANIFSQFGTIATTDFSSERAFIRVFFPNFETAKHETTTIVIPGEFGEVARILINAGAYQDKSGPRDYSTPEFQRLWQQYFLPGILTKYGSPEKIFLDTTRQTLDPATSYPFALWVVYPQHGFFISYHGVNSKIGDNIQICPIQSGIEINIWDVEKSNYEEFMKREGTSGFSLGPQPIEEVTDFSIDSFHETFRSGTINTCFETPASLWPPNK